MSEGQPHDLRPWRRLKRTDYYAAKAASEYKQPTEFPKCENCGLRCEGKVYQGSKSGKYICQECMNETA